MITEQRIRELLAESKAPYAILGGNMPAGLLAFARLVEAENRAELEAWRLNACQFHDDTPARTALAELIALKNLKTAIETWVCDDSTGKQWPKMPYAERMAASDDYARRKPLAWAAARAALAQQEEPK